MSSLAEQWGREGFVLARGVYSAEEIGAIREHFMAWNASDRKEDFDKIDPTGQDPLAKYPRIIHPHRRDALSMRFMLDSRLRDLMVDFLGEEPVAAQTMFYFKPPQARGQALHQDQTYLRANPGTCLAAWLAVDDCDDENGCLQVVPGSHVLPILCPVGADLSVSFTGETVPVPDGFEVVKMHMKAGDVLFFHGNLIHGSGPNTTTDRFRRALIGHYLTADAREAWKFYHPVLRFDGTEVELGDAEMGSECGRVSEGGIEMVSGSLRGPGAPH